MKTGADIYRDVQALKPVDVSAYFTELPKVIVAMADVVQALGQDVAWLPVLLHDMAKVQVVVESLIAAARERQKTGITSEQYMENKDRLSAVLERIA